ncbi:hypothetical protein [Ktedonospora formicarum]|nr:hypothetical protein [Ktedonospora formicarum]
MLIDEAFDDLKNVANGEDVSEAMLGSQLPVHYLPKYSYLFLKQFLVCIITVIRKLAQPEGAVFSSVAEELAAWLLIQEAEGILETMEEDGEEIEEEAFEPEEGFDFFVDMLYEDLDFQFLYDDA